MSQASRANPSLEPVSTSTSLISLIKSNDEAGWCRITELYGPLIYFWCRKSRLAPEDSADIVQEVFRSVLIHISTFERDERRGSFRAWLWTITRNKIRDFFKVHSGKIAATGGTDVYLMLKEYPDHITNDPSGVDLTNPSTDGSVLRVLKLIRSEIKKTTWDAFWRSTIDGVDPAVVAEELGVSIHSVWQAKSRVLRRARQLLEM